MVGRTIGKYRVVARLGRGGMGTVYRAVDETLDREVAIKILNPELADTDVMKRFRAEASMLAKLNHPAIATIYELHRSDEDLLMVMEFVRGESLDQFVQRSGPVDPERAAYLVAQVLDAIGHAHAAGIIHRDLKPSNVMVTDHGAVKIMDFGIARVRGAEHMTSDGYMMGTPAYMSPEQVLCQEVDGRSDLYSVGVMFYRLLTGKLPFEADTAIGMVQKQISDTPTPARLHRADLPTWAVTILDRALAKSPADRYQTAEELRGALLDAIQNGGTETTSQLSAAALSRPPKPPAATGDTDAETRMAPWPPLEAITQLATPSRAAAAPPRAAAAPAPAATTAPKPTTVAAPEAKPVSATGPAGSAKVASPSTAKQKSHTPAIAAAIVALIAVATVVFGIMSWRRSQSPPTTSTSADTAAAAPADGSPPAVAPPIAAAEPTPPPAAVEPAATPPPASIEPPSPSTPPPDAAPPARNPATAGATAEAPGSPTTPRPPRVARSNTPPVVDTPAPEPPSAPPVIVATTPAKPAVQFRAKLLVKEDDKARERDATVRLADGQVTVTGPDRTILSATPYNAVLSVIYSKSKQPLWDGPAGATPIQQIDGGAFGFFKGGRHWVSLRTKERFVVLRLEENQVPSVLSAIEDRTGKTTVRVAEPKSTPQ